MKALVLLEAALVCLVCIQLCFCQLPGLRESPAGMLEADHSYTPGSGSFHPGGSYAAPAGGYQQAAPYQHDLAYTVQQHAAAGHSMQQQLAAAGGYDSAPGHHQYAHMHPHEPQVCAVCQHTIQVLINLQGVQYIQGRMDVYCLRARCGATQTLIGTTVPT